MEDVCYACALNSDSSASMAGRTDEGVFIDTRTGRKFCAHHIEALVSWELDGRPDPDEYPYPEWISETVAPR